MPAASHNLNDGGDLSSVRSQTTTILDESIERVRREEQEVSAEIDAFEQFAGRLERIEPRLRQRGPVGLEGANSQPKPVRQVQAAYRETVLSTPHFQREYDESYFGNMRAEFGPDLASALNPEKPAPFTPVLKQTLAQAADQCIAARSTLVDSLKRERKSLCQSRAKLGEFFNELKRTQQPWKSDAAQVSTMESIAASRQEVIHQSVAPRGVGDEHQLHQYLYAEKPWDFPVLFAIGRLRAAGQE